MKLIRQALVRNGLLIQYLSFARENEFLRRGPSQGALNYLIQTGIIALASFVLSFIVVNGLKLSSLVDPAVLGLFVRDIQNLPEMTPKTISALKGIGRALVGFILALLLNDNLGGVVYGLTALFLGLGHVSTKSYSPLSHNHPDRSTKEIRL